MKMHQKKLQQLRDLAELLADQRLAEVAAKSTTYASVQSNVTAIQDRRMALAGTATDPVLAAMMGQQAERLRRVQVAEMERLAAARAELEHAKDQARPVFGRKAVLDKLLKS